MAIQMQSGTIYGDRTDLLVAVQDRPLPFLPIALEVLPSQPVDKPKGQFGKLDLSNWTQNLGADGVSRAANGRTKRVDVYTGEITFSTSEMSISTAYDDRKRSELETRFGLESAMMEILRQAIIIRREIIAAGLLFNTSTFPLSGTTGFTVSNDWVTSSSAKIKDDVKKALTYLAQNGGNPMDASGVCSLNTFLQLLVAESLVNDKRYVQTPSMLVTDQNRAVIAAQLGLKDLKVGNCYYNSAAEGVTPSLTNAWDDGYFGVGNLGSAGDAPYQKCVGRTYYNTSHLGLETADMFRDDDSRSDMLRFGCDIGQQVNFTNAFVLIDIKP